MYIFFILFFPPPFSNNFFLSSPVPFCSILSPLSNIVIKQCTFLSSTPPMLSVLQPRHFTFSTLFPLFQSVVHSKYNIYRISVWTNFGHHQIHFHLRKSTTSLFCLVTAITQGDAIIHQSDHINVRNFQKEYCLESDRKKLHLCCGLLHLFCTMCNCIDHIINR